MMNFLKTILTEDDDDSVYCIVRSSALVVVVLFVGLSIYSAVHNGTFDYQGFGVGSGALLAGIGGALGLKAKMGG